MTLKGVLIVTGIWLVYSVFYTFMIISAVPAHFLDVIRGSLLYSAFFFLYSIPIWFLTIRVMDIVAWRWKLATHAVLGLVYALAVYETNVYFYRVLFGENSQGTIQLLINKQWIIYGNFTFYVIQFAIYHSIRSYQRLRDKEQEASELLALAKERELAALKAQINPHFLFNTLNGISAMVKRDPEEARNMIARLAELLRFGFESFNHERIPLRDELYFVKSYLEIEKHRFGERLRVEYDIDREILGEPVPPMILQPLVENAVIHGIAPKEDGGTIKLTIYPEFGKLNFSLSDTGAGLNGKSSDDLLKNGIGLKNTDARLRKIYGEQSRLEFENIDGSGFGLRFTIPI